LLLIEQSKSVDRHIMESCIFIRSFHKITCNELLRTSAQKPDFDLVFYAFFQNLGSVSCEVTKIS